MHDGPPPFTTNAAEQGIRPALAATVQGGSPRMVTSLVTSHAARPRNGHRRRPGHPPTAQFPHVSPGRCGGCPALPGRSGGWARPAARGAANSGKGSQAGPGHRRRPGGGKAARVTRAGSPLGPVPRLRAVHTSPAPPHRLRTSRGPQRPWPVTRVRRDGLSATTNACASHSQPAAHSPGAAPKNSLPSGKHELHSPGLATPRPHQRPRSPTPADTARSAPPRSRSNLHIRPAPARQLSARARRAGSLRCGTRVHRLPPVVTFHDPDSLQLAPDPCRYGQDLVVVMASQAAPYGSFCSDPHCGSSACGGGQSPGSSLSRLA